MVSFSVAVLLMTAALAPAANAQGYGGVPQGVKGHRTTTTFAPDVIPSDQQALNFYEQNPNPVAPVHNQPGPAGTGNVPSYLKPGHVQGQPGHVQGQPGHVQGQPGHVQGQPGHVQGQPGHVQGQPRPGQGQPGHVQGQPRPGQGQPGPGQGHLPDNSIVPDGSVGGDFWWMNQDNPFKGAGVPPQLPATNPNKPTIPGPGPYPNPSPVSHPNPNPSPAINPTNPFIHGGAQIPAIQNPGCQGGQACSLPAKPHPGAQGCQQGQNCGGGINPNNPFIQGGKPSGNTYPVPKPVAPAHGGVNPSNPFLQGVHPGSNQGPNSQGPYPGQSNQEPNSQGPHAGQNHQGPNNQGSYPGQNNQGPNNQGPHSGNNQGPYPGQDNQGPYPGASGQTVACSGNGLICVQKNLCHNGVVVDNGNPILQVKAGSQRCDVTTQACCRLPLPAQGGGSYPNQNAVGPIKNTNYQEYQGTGSAPGANGVPLGGSIYDGPTQNPVVRPYTGPLNTTPYPGCAAALKCVELIFCTAEGVMSDSPVALTREQEENRVPLSECSNPDTGILGKCCRDPNYKDPWPGGMMGHDHGHGDHGVVDSNGFPTGQYTEQSQYNPTVNFPPQSASQAHQQNQQGSISSGPLIANQPQPFPQKPFQGSYQPGAKPLPNKPPTYPSVSGQQYIQPQVPQNQPKPFPNPSVEQEQRPFPTPAPQPSYQQEQRPFPTPAPQPSYQQEQNAFPQEQPKPFPQPVKKPYQQQPGSKPFPNVLPQQIPQQPIPRPIVDQYKPVDVPLFQEPILSINQQATLEYEEPQQYPKSPETNIPAQPDVIPGASCGVKRTVDRSGLSELDCGFGEYPWHVIVSSATSKQALCSGVLISNNAVATAAHCVKDLDSTDIYIQAGVSALGSPASPKQPRTSPVAAIARHPHFDEGSLANDMAVLLLSTPMQLDSHIDTICLPEVQASSTRNCVATGFGKVELMAGTPGTNLHQIGVNIIPNNVCENKLKSTSLGKYFILNQSFQCAVPTVPAHDLCKVDAGSPISCARDDGHYELSGLYSWDVGCNTPNNPTALASVDTEWIQSVLNRPIDVILREELNEIEKRKKAHEVVDVESKPGFSQGYGRK